MGTLESQQVAEYRRDGYLLLNRQIFASDRLAFLRQIFAEHLAKRGPQLSDELDTPHWRDPRLFEFLLAPEVLDIVEPILGPDILLWSSHFISKEPFVGRATPWHEDSAYWNGRLSRYDSIVTVWLSLDGSDRENGCMRVIPGTHDHGFSRYEPVGNSAAFTFPTAIAEVDDARAVAFVLRPGEASLHDGRIVHGAGPNQSARRRTGYTMRYIAATTHVLPEANEGFLLWLARGQDRAGNSYADRPSST
ncbi:phytanoyl-CoA dioxygenase family protein [Actinoplanes sp. NPDC049118]|uniref:phytanoyl-CoA dioxygenase family protein n=1 Tax=Actinoplanes sp. NPDC049118 TaxID=3155769 RepID=UPI0033EFFE35